MAWVATAIAGSALIGGYLNNQAAGRGADAMRDAANSSNAAQLQMYNQTRTDQAPWRAAGSSALSDLAKGNILQNFQGDPGYQFRMAQGTKALNASAAAKGMASGGAQAKALERYGQDYGSNEYNNAYNRQYNRLSEIAGFGQNANNSSAQAGSNFANNFGNNLQGGANAYAAGQVGQANAISGGLTNGANTWANYQMMNRIFPAGGGAGGGYMPSDSGGWTSGREI